MGTINHLNSIDLSISFVLRNILLERVREVILVVNNTQIVVRYGHNVNLDQIIAGQIGKSISEVSRCIITHNIILEVSKGYRNVGVISHCSVE